MYPKDWTCPEPPDCTACGGITSDCWDKCPECDKLHCMKGACITPQPKPTNEQKWAQTHLPLGW